jgi:hypothetical protein
MIIGFTGHQRIDHPDRWGWVQEQFAQILREVASPNDRALTALAAGGDQLFSQVAIAAGIAIEVVVPCVGYEAAFERPDQLAQYGLLLARASNVTRLDFPAPSEDAFLAAGIHVVNQSGLVVALWNGNAPAGKGGTGDVVEYARKRKLPVIHVDPDRMQVFGRTEDRSGEA